MPGRRVAALRKILPGLLLAGVVGLAAHLIARLILPFGLAVGAEVPIAMLLGLTLANLGRLSPRTLPGIKFAVKYVLGVGIVLLGLRLNLQAIGNIGARALGLVLMTITIACTFAIFVGRRLGVPTRMALLIGVGTPVCGVSAIAAAAPLIKADDRDVSWSIATITVLGTTAVLFYPVIGHALGLDVLTFGLWSGSAVPDTAQTIATGSVYSTVARDVATIVKLVRNLLIVPLLLLIAGGWHRFDGDATSAETTRRSIRKAFPIFLVGFLITGLVRTARLIDPETVLQIDNVTRACFVVALAGFGLQTRLGHVRTVASTSNFGAPKALAGWAEGTILSMATGGDSPLAIPAGLAFSGDQAGALKGAVRVYTAQAPSFLNNLANSKAETGGMPAVSNPMDISINNAFGRPWFTNAPGGIGMESVLDPDGLPLTEAPSELAGGVFAGSATDRRPQLHRGGLTTAAVGNVFLGASPDTTGRAVFGVATADGGLNQVHVEEGVDGLAPPGTLAPQEVPTRVGMVFNWVPERFLYVTDPGNDAVLQLRLDDDFEIFSIAEIRRLDSPYLSDPIDLAPAVPEIANPAFSSNTTLAGGADLYVANRGSGTVVRMCQDGRIVGVANIGLPGGGLVGPDQLNGIAVSPDARRIWVSLGGENGSVVEIPAFGAPD